MPTHVPQHTPLLCVPLQAAPNLQYFSKGASAGSRLFAVINRKPEIDTGEAMAIPASRHSMGWVYSIFRFVSGLHRCLQGDQWW